MTHEIWKDIKGYENSYEVSNYGNIRSSKNKITHSKLHGRRVWKSKILKFKGFTPKTGYRVDLWKDGKPKTFLVARLVATTFLENLIDTKMTVNHKDGNRMNNRVENLEWLSLGDNIRHAFENGLMPYKKVEIINFESQGITYHNSMTRASYFIGKSHGYISANLKKGITRNKIWGWRLVE